MKKLLALVICIVFLLTLSVTVFAQSPNAEIPERNGDYPDPDHPGLRVRVFVHEPKERLTSSATAVCDNSSTYVDTVGKAGWSLPRTTVNYKINSSSAPSTISSGSLATIAGSGFTTWMNAISASKPSLVQNGETLKTRSALDYENIITWGRTSGSALGVTYVWYYTATHEVADVDTILNKKFPWSLGVCSTSSYDAGDILTHEQGHWFGLNDEYGSGFADDTMFGYGSKAELKKISPEQGDVAGINLIYPQ